MFAEVFAGQIQQRRLSYVISEVGEHGNGSSLVDRQMLCSSHLA